VTLAHHFQPGQLALSFELFPPKNDAGLASLEENMAELMTCHPAFVTCTYGAGGSTRDRTLQVLARVRQAYPDLPLATHLTCVGSTVDMLEDYLRQADAQGIDYVVALRGDPPKGESAFRATEGGLRYASELVGLVRGGFPRFGVAVAGYPEKHPESPSVEDDIRRLKEKVDQGADAVITQFFYDNSDFFRFRDRCAAAGIEVPIVPGILPITNLAQIQRFAKLCESTIPEMLASRMGRYEDGSEGQLAVGVYWSTRQIEELAAQGAPGVHFYVLNRARATLQVCRALALGQQPVLSGA